MCEQNAGAAGIDGMTTAQLRPWLGRTGRLCGRPLDAGTYQPQPSGG